MKLSVRRAIRAQFADGSTVFENHRKRSHSTLRAKRATFTFWIDKSSLKMPKNSQFRKFWENWRSGQAMLPDRSFLVGQKLVENANIEFFKWDILSHFQTLWRSWLLDMTMGQTHIAWLLSNGVSNIDYFCLASHRVCYSCQLFFGCGGGELCMFGERCLMFNSIILFFFLYNSSDNALQLRWK